MWAAKSANCWCRIRLVTQKQVEQAADEQKNMRSRKLGDYLLDTAVVYPEQLMLALSQQSKMPMIRMGEALTRLGYISEEQLQQALEKQKTERSVPLGELLDPDGLPDPARPQHCAGSQNGLSDGGRQVVSHRCRRLAEDSDDHGQTA